MNIRSTTPVLKRFATSSMVVATAVAMTISSVTTPVLADRFDDQIRAIEQQMGAYQAQAASLRSQADTLQRAVAELQAQQDTIQAQINLSQAKYDQLVQQIEETKNKIERNQNSLSSTIGNLYVNSRTSPVEMLASSKNIGYYLDQQEFQSSISRKIESTIRDIKVLKNELEEKKKDVERVLADQTAQKNALVAKKDEQAKLLADTQGSEAAYQNIIGQQNNEINSLRAQQAAANAARARSYGGTIISSGSGGGGYPTYLASAPQDSVVDPWGMYNRECVSYTAWKVHQAYGNMPYWGGYGNANQWPGNARAAGIPTGNAPRVGSVAVMSGGYYGHVAWVEAVHGDTITVSQYNWGVRGEYSQMTISAGAFDTYIYFGG